MHQAIGRSICPPPPAHTANKITPHKPRPRLFHASQTNIPENKKRTFPEKQKTKNGKENRKNKTSNDTKNKIKRHYIILFTSYHIYYLYCYTICIIIYYMFILFPLFYHSICICICIIYCICFILFFLSYILVFHHNYNNIISTQKYHLIPYII